MLEVIVYDKALNNGVTAQVAVANMARTSDGRLASQDGSQVASTAIATGNDNNTRLLTAALTAPIASMLGGVLIFETDGQSAGDGEIELEVYLTVRDT